MVSKMISTIVLKERQIHRVVIYTHTEKSGLMNVECFKNILGSTKEVNTMYASNKMRNHDVPEIELYICFIGLEKKVF